jgi:hypothetical protein
MLDGDNFWRHHHRGPMPKPAPTDDHVPRAQAPAPQPSEAGTVDSTKWTGDVDRQKAELKAFFVILAVAVALAAPLAVWVGQELSALMGF